MILERGIEHVAAKSSGAERARRRIGGNAVENAEGPFEGARGGTQTAERSAGERGAERGPRGANSDFRETIPQCSTRVH